MQEFSAISVSTYSADGLAEKLTEASREGWEVVSIVNAGSSITAYLQRPATDAVPTQPDAEPDTTDAAPVAETPVIEAPVIEAPVIEEPVVEELVVDELAIDEPAAFTPTGATAEPEAPVEAPVVEAPAADIVEEVAPSSLADELAALVPQLGDTPTPDPEPEPEPPSEPEPTPAEEPSSSFALGGTSEQPAEPEPADATPAATPAAEGSDTAAAPGAAPQGWYDDPSGRFQYRYWDGRQWTEHVSRDGQQYTDPPVA